MFDEITERGNFRQKVCMIVSHGRGHGYKLKVHNALRSVAEQKVKVADGVSKTKNSKHLAGRDGLARAADVIDERWGWKETPLHVWVMIGRLALTQGCEWGGLWGLPFSMRQKFEEFLLDRSKPFDPKAWDGKIGWDPAHVEMR